jgi:hypothetical protein
MFRFALTLVFTLATVFGPGLCCCAYANRGSDANNSHLDGKSKTFSLSCCTPKDSCCGTSDETKAYSEPSKQHKSGECPCKKDKESVAVIRTDAQQLETNPETISFFVLGTVVQDFGAWIAPSVAQAISSTSRGRPALSTDDLLHTHHRLRC